MTSNSKTDTSTISDESENEYSGELDSNNTRTEMAGADFNVTKSTNHYAGITYVNVLNSNAPYPKAAPNGSGAPEILIGARAGLNALNFYGKTSPIKSLSNFFTTFDLLLS